MGNLYRPGSYYRACARTGYKVRAERTAKEWTGNYVRDQSFELRNAQDFVRGRRDNQIAPDARPRPPPVFEGPAYRIIQNECDGPAIRITQNGQPRIIS